MIKLILSCSLLVSFLLSISNYPIFLVLLICAQTLIICLTLMLMTPTSWYSFILFLVFMGGLMVLFIYISSLASNEQFKLKDYATSMKLIFLGVGALMFISLTLNKQIIKTLMIEPMNFIYKIYTPSMMVLTFLTMLYLLLALVIIVNITSMQEGALRQLK